MSKYVATRNVHHDGKAYRPGELVEFKDGNDQHDQDITDLVRLGAIKPSEELAALMALTLDQLKELATSEEVQVPEGASSKNAVASVIIAHRAHLADQAKDGTED